MQALVIGSSGGIGRAILNAFQARGAACVGLSRQEHGFDVTDPDVVDRQLSALDGGFHRIVVATGLLSVGGAGPEKALEAISADHMAQVMAVNTIGPALILRHVPRLLAPGTRTVTAVLTARVGSIGDNRMGGWYSYRASKAAANMIVRSTAIEVARKQKEAIVVALHPGTVETPFTAAYPAHSKYAPEVAATRLLSVMDDLTPEQTGGFFDYSGAEVMW